MLKAEVNEKTTTIEICGTLPDICTDLTRIISGINERLSEKNHKLGYDFRVVFTKGFMDGMCFDDDREHMNHYLAEGDERCEIKKEKLQNKESFAEFLEGFIDFLKERRNELEKKNEELKKQLADLDKEDKDEAE